MKKEEVWRMVNRTEYEHAIEVSDIRIGQVIRIVIKDNILDHTCFVQEVGVFSVSLLYLAGFKLGEKLKVLKKNINSVTEICSSPLLYRIKATVSGTKAKKGKRDIQWDSVPEEKEKSYKCERKPRMLLRVPNDCKFRRSWHLFKIFPKEEFEYCTNLALQKAYGNRVIENFDTIAYFPALFALRRLGLSSRLAFQTELA